MRPGSIKTAVAGSIVALVLTACSNDSTPASPAAGGSTSTAPSSVSPSGSAAERATVILSDSALGRILTDDQGNTVYQFEMDSGGTSACNEGCDTTWPPLEASGKPSGGNGVDDSLLGTIKRADGTTQVTYAGHPLYHYSGDQTPGDTNGQGIGDVWYAVAASGDPLKGDQGGDQNAGGTGGYGGGGYG